MGLYEGLRVVMENKFSGLTPSPKTNVPPLKPTIIGGSSDSKLATVVIYIWMLALLCFVGHLVYLLFK